MDLNPLTLLLLQGNIPESDWSVLDYLGHVKLSVQRTFGSAVDSFSISHYFRRHTFKHQMAGMTSYLSRGSQHRVSHRRTRLYFVLKRV